MGKYVIEMQDVRKRYGDFELELSLQVPEGTVTGLIGRNGAGKSTTLKAILGLLRPDSGSICVLGKDAGHLTGADKENLGVAFADLGFSNFLTLEDMIHILKKMYRTFDAERFRERCGEQALPFRKQIKEFSTGMKAKLRVLIALSHDTKLLLLDEPTAGLDVIARNEILDMLRSYLEEDSGRSILVSSHISSDLEGLCDDVYLIHEGRMILHEDTDRILGSYGILKVSESDYEQLDRRYLITSRKETFGYSCLTGERQFYLDNYPGMVVENGGFDSVIVHMLGGEPEKQM